MSTVRRRPFHYGWVVVSSSFLTVLGAHGFGRFAYSLILPSMKEGLNLDYFQMGLLATGNFTGYVTLAVIGGLLASRYGSRVIISASAALMGVTMIMTGLSTNFEYALLARLLTGFGNGGAYLPSVALPSIWFVFRLRGRTTGLVSAGSGVGFALSGIAVPLILSAYGAEGWRYAWYYLGAVLLAIAVVDYALVRNRPEEMGLPAVGAEKNNPREADRGRSRLQWGLVYKNRAVWFVGSIYLTYGFSYIIYVTFFAAYLENLGWARGEAASLWFIVGIISILSGLIWGWVSDVLGRKYGLAIAFTILASAYLLFATTPTTLGLYCSALLFGISAWSIPTVAIATVSDYVGAALRSAAAGFVTLFFGVGQVIGPAVGGYVIETSQIFAYSFLIAAIGSLIGAAAALTLKPPHNPQARSRIRRV